MSLEANQSSGHGNERRSKSRRAIVLIAGLTAVAALAGCTSAPKMTPEQTAVSKLRDDPRVFNGYVFVGEGAKVLKQPVNIDNTELTKDRTQPKDLTKPSDVDFTVGTGTHKFVVMERPIVVTQANGSMAIGCYYQHGSDSPKGSGDDYEWVDLGMYPYMTEGTVPIVKAYFQPSNDSKKDFFESDLTEKSNALNYSLPLDMGIGNGPILQSERHFNNYWPAICHDTRSDEQTTRLMDSLQKEYDAAVTIVGN